MDQFQWSHPAKINRLQIENLMRLDFIDKRANVLIVGGSGLGKSHIASSLIRQACLKGYNALFTSAIEIVNYVRQCWKHHDKDNYSTIISCMPQTYPSSLKS